MTNTESTTNTPTYRADADARRRTTETKSGVKTTETKSVFNHRTHRLRPQRAWRADRRRGHRHGDDGQGFGARSAWLYVILLSIGYMISRGLAKAGSRRR